MFSKISLELKILIMPINYLGGEFSFLYFHPRIWFFSYLIQVFLSILRLNFVLISAISNHLFLSLQYVHIVICLYKKCLHCWDFQNCVWKQWLQEVSCLFWHQYEYHECLSIEAGQLKVGDHGLHHLKEYWCLLLVDWKTLKKSILDIDNCQIHLVL